MRVSRAKRMLTDNLLTSLKATLTQHARTGHRPARAEGKRDKIAEQVMQQHEVPRLAKNTLDRVMAQQALANEEVGQLRKELGEPLPTALAANGAPIDSEGLAG